MSLIELCKKGDLEGVKAALQSGHDVNTMDEDGYTGLMRAVFENHNSVVELLLRTPNIDVNLSSENGYRCALREAMRSKNNEGLKLLLNVQNIDVNIIGYSADRESDNYGYWNAVHWAVIENNIEVLKLLLSHPSLTALTLNSKFGRGAPVMFAVWRDRLEHLMLLAADPRVDLNTTDMAGRSLDHRSLDHMARHVLARKPDWLPKVRKILAEAGQRRERRRRLIREQKRQVSKVLLVGLYDSDSPISKLLGVRTEVMGEIIWQKMLVQNWQIFPETCKDDQHANSAKQARKPQRCDSI